MFRTPLEWTVASLRLTHEKEIENLDIDWELQLRLRAVPPRENIPSKSFRPDRSEGIRYSKKRAAESVGAPSLCIGVCREWTIARLQLFSRRKSIETCPLRMVMK
jgi:hypothetical protein